MSGAIGSLGVAFVDAGAAIKHGAIYSVDVITGVFKNLFFSQSYFANLSEKQLNSFSAAHLNCFRQSAFNNIHVKFLSQEKIQSLSDRSVQYIFNARKICQVVQKMKFEQVQVVATNNFDIKEIVYNTDIETLKKLFAIRALSRKILYVFQTPSKAEMNVWEAKWAEVAKSDSIGLRNLMLKSIGLSHALGPNFYSALTAQHVQQYSQYLMSDSDTKELQTVIFKNMPKPLCLKVLEKLGADLRVINAMPDFTDDELKNLLPYLGGKVSESAANRYRSRNVTYLYILTNPEAIAKLPIDDLANALRIVPASEISRHLKTRRDINQAAFDKLIAGLADLAPVERIQKTFAIYESFPQFVTIENFKRIVCDKALDSPELKPLLNSDFFINLHRTFLNTPKILASDVIPEASCLLKCNPMSDKQREILRLAIQKLAPVITKKAESLNEAYEFIKKTLAANTYDKLTVADQSSVASKISFVQEIMGAFKSNVALIRKWQSVLGAPQKVEIQSKSIWEGIFRGVGILNSHEDLEQKIKDLESKMAELEPVIERNRAQSEKSQKEDEDDLDIFRWAASINWTKTGNWGAILGINNMSILSGPEYGDMPEFRKAYKAKFKEELGYNLSPEKRVAALRDYIHGKKGA